MHLKQLRMRFKYVQVVLMALLATCCYCDSVVHLSGKDYVRFDASRFSSNLFSNKVDVSFKTANPSGILLILTGKVQDQLFLHLRQGKLRYTLMKNGDKLINSITGSKLDDNQWHRIQMIRYKSLSHVRLDNGPPKVILSPTVSPILRFDRSIYLGGAYAAMERLQTVETGLANFSGCLRQVKLDNVPLLEILRSMRMGATVAGALVWACRDLHFTSLELTNPSSYLKLRSIPRNPAKDLVLSASFRTFDSEGILIYSESRTCQLFLGLQRSQVYLEIKQDSIVQAQAEVNFKVDDGLWHDFFAIVTATETYLSVDSLPKVVVPLGQKRYYCTLPKFLFVGGGAEKSFRRGFVGCLRSLQINNYDIGLNESLGAMTRGVKLDSCQMEDKCFPNPCKNEGKCKQNWQSYTCTCEKTTSYGEHCEKSIYKNSCQAYSEMGLTQPSLCLLRDDESSKSPPFTALCDFTTRKEGVTIFRHDQEPSSLFRKLTLSQDLEIKLHYTTELSMIQSVMRVSESCYQNISIYCKGANLVGITSPGRSVLFQNTQNSWGNRCTCIHSVLCDSGHCACSPSYYGYGLDSISVTDMRFLPIVGLTFRGHTDSLINASVGALRCIGTSREGKILSDVLPADILTKVCLRTLSIKDLIQKNSLFGNLSLPSSSQDKANRSVWSYWSSDDKEIPKKPASQSAKQLDRSNKPNQPPNSKNDKSESTIPIGPPSGLTIVQIVLIVLFSVIALFLVIKIVSVIQKRMRGTRNMAAQGETRAVNNLQTLEVKETNSSTAECSRSQIRNEATLNALTAPCEGISSQGMRPKRPSFRLEIRNFSWKRQLSDYWV